MYEKFFLCAHVSLHFDETLAYNYICNFVFAKCIVYIIIIISQDLIEVRLVKRIIILVSVS